MKKEKVAAFIIMLGFAIACLSTDLWAADLYLDNGTSGGCTNGSTDYDPSGRSCGGAGTDTVYVDLRTASNNLGSGDTLYIRAGSYGQTSDLGLAYTSGILVIDGTGTTVRNYGTEVVWLQTGNDHTDIQSDDYDNPVAISGTNCTLRGYGYNLHTWGCVILSGTNCSVIGVDMSGGWDHQSSIGDDAWYDVIRIKGSTDALVQDCKIHDNYNHGTTTAAPNKALIIHDGDVDTVVENSEFYNAVTDFVYHKVQSASGTVESYYRKNWFHGDGNIAGASSGHDESKEIYIYQNVFTDNPSQGIINADTSSGNIYVYNNTIYNCSGIPFEWKSNANVIQWFNNIIVSTSGTSYSPNFNDVTTSLGYLDYNIYYENGGTITARHNSSSFTTVSSWSSHLGSGSGTEDYSNENNPGFDPDDSTVDGSDPSDFKRASYTADGRGSTWPSVRGAYITGSETIGLLNGATDTTPPSVSGRNPDDGATGILESTNIVAHVTDTGDGVDSGTISMTVEGSPVSPSISGTSSDYTLTYDPPVDFSYDQVVNVTIDADDNNGNSMTTDEYSFTIRSEPDTTDPVCTITTPADDPHDNGSDSTADLAGTASDASGIASVSWACPTCTPSSGSASGTTTWSISNITLAGGNNTFTVTATDDSSNNNTGQDTVVISYSSPTPTATLSRTAGTGGLMNSGSSN